MNAKVGCTSQDDFWRWFLAHESEYFEFDPVAVPERERLFDKLAAELNKLDSDLVFEFGPPETKREFVISAGGISARSLLFSPWLLRRPLSIVGK